MINGLVQIERKSNEDILLDIEVKGQHLKIFQDLYFHLVFKKLCNEHFLA
jgi:hypothetical protein